MKKAFRIFLYLLILASLASTSKACTISKKDLKAIQTFKQKTYGKRFRLIIRNADDTTDSELARRKGKRLVYVDKFTTKSYGSYGIVKAGIFKGNYIKYACKMPKRKTVSCYYIYNPNSNYTDDIVAIVTNGKIAK